MAATQNNARQFLEDNQETPVVQHIQGVLAAAGKTPGDVAEILIRSLRYKVPSRYPYYDQAPIGMYELTYRDQATYQQWWHFGLEIPLTIEEAELYLIDLAQLTDADRAFFEEALHAHHITPEHTKAPHFQGSARLAQRVKAIKLRTWLGVIIVLLCIPLIIQDFWPDLFPWWGRWAIGIPAVLLALCNIALGWKARKR